MLKAKVFQSGNSQAIRIPKELQTTEKEFNIRKCGNCYFLIPDDDPWALLRFFFDMNGIDYSIDRAQPFITEQAPREPIAEVVPDED